MSIPVSGEHHERAVEAMAFERFMAAYERDVRAREVAEKHWRQVSQGVRDAFLVPARRDIDVYHRSLAEQGVHLVDLREVVEELREWVKYREDRLPHYGNRTQRADGEAWVLDALDAKLDYLVERRFGGNERKTPK